ncbi:serine/threonine-protein kinase [Henriciella aquimarina]|uniref:serine/threonine-protein kinase n=1 Tax=Henriciella aquimarina TaxID=545261 RepID=UPI000A025751|nr:serine/threonine-protein kinase [Henriciella aquimarina]
MLRCSACQTELPDNARFCAACGTAVEDIETEVETVAALRTVSGLETVAPGRDDMTGGDYAPAPTGMAPGTMVAGKYRIERMIGAGGMGMVYKAIETVTDTPVALKVIPSGQVSSERAVQRLIEEGKTTRTISHPNVVKTYDIGVWQGAPYIAMEYIEGKPLHIWRTEKMSRNEEVPARIAGQIVKEVLNGLEAAHAAGVIHRDLKPENIMLLGEPTAQDAQVKIVDFGIALATTQKSDDGTGTGLGTQLYMAPEQIRNANAANAAADLYSVSKIFYELIVGVLPTGHWSPPSDGRSDVPPAIDKLIERGLSTNRNLRPQTAADYREAMIEGFNTSLRRNAGPDERKREYREAQQDLKNAYGRVFRTIPKWGWAVIAIVVLIAVFGGLAEETGSGNCYYDAYGNVICQ